MELRKLRAQEVVVGMICDMCNENCTKDKDDPDFKYESGILSASWGYFSNGKDLTREECHLCEDCFGEVREFIKSKGGKVRKTNPSSFQSTGPDYIQKSGIDFLRLPGLSIAISFRDEALKSLQEQADEQKEPEQ